MSVRPTFMGFEASKSAIFASQKALDITGQNLANMSTEGYTRQRADQVSVSSEAYRNRITGSAYNHIGMGTSVEGISQVRDDRMDTAFRNSYSNTSYYSKSNDMLRDIESIMSEIDAGTSETGYALGFGLSEMQEAISNLTQDVSNINATVFADTVKNVCSILNREYAELEEAKQSYIEDFRFEVSDANSIIEDISALNKQIKDVMSGYSYTEQYGPNELLDKRNVLLDELSAFGKIEVKANSDGTVDVTMNRHECIKGDKTDSLILIDNPDGGVSLRWKTDGQDATLENGILKASSDIINGRGVNVRSASDTDARGFKYYQDALDTFAVNLTEILNTTIPSEVDEMGNVLKYQSLVGAIEYDDNGNEIVNSDCKITTAANICISDKFLKNPSVITQYDIFSQVPGASTLSIKNNDTQYLMNLKAKLGDQSYTLNNGHETFNGKLYDFVIDFSVKLGSDAKYAKSNFEQCELYSNELQNNRDSVSNVSESEETMNMLTFNKAFQAAAKMMTTMDELLDVIINQIGALG